MVFASEQELKTHMAREHGQEMTKAERKQAFSVPVGFNVCVLLFSMFTHV